MKKATKKAGKVERSALQLAHSVYQMPIFRLDNGKCVVCDTRHPHSKTCGFAKALRLASRVIREAAKGKVKHGK